MDSEATAPRTAPRIGVEIGSFTPAHWLAVVLAAITGAVHLYLYTAEGWIPFLLAGLGFYGAVALLIVLPGYRTYLYPLGALFTAAQIVGYVLLPLGPLWLGVGDKIVQVALIGVLAYLFVRARRTTDASTAVEGRVERPKAA